MRMMMLNGRIGLSYDNAVMRDGVRLATQKCVEKMLRGSSYFSAVLPCRYGKSDVIRMTNLELIDRGIIAVGVVLAPTSPIVGQLLRTDKVTAMLERYGVRLRGQYVTDRFESKRQVEEQLRRMIGGASFPIRPLLIGATLQLVGEHSRLAKDESDLFIRWCQAVRSVTGVPVGLFIDECHYASRENTFGGAVRRLVEHAGARACLLTATKVRGDGELIEGFNWDEIRHEVERFSLTVRAGGQERDKAERRLYEAERVTYRLNPDYELSLREAMRERPQPLCRLICHPVRVKLEEIGEAEGGLVYLDELPLTARTRSVLSKATRSRRVLEQLAEVSLRELALLRRQELPDAALMGFCGSDRPEDDEENGRIREAEQALLAVAKRLGMSLRIMTVTTNDGDAEARLASFPGGPFDVLLVKVIGGTGLDASGIKITVDFSSVRAPATWEQRTWRSATPHLDAASGNLHLLGRHVSIRDPFFDVLWDCRVRGEDCEQVDTKTRLLGKETVDFEPPETTPGGYAIVGAEPGTIRDLDGGRAEIDIVAVRESLAINHPAAYAALFNVPETELERVIGTIAMHVRGEVPTRSTSSLQGQTASATAANARDDRKTLNAIFNAVRDIRVGQILQERGDQGNNALFAEISKQIVGPLIKAHAGRLGVSLDVKKSSNGVEVHCDCARAALALAKGWRISDDQIIFKANKPEITRELLDAVRANL